MTAYAYKLDASTLAATDISTAFSTYTLPTEYALFQNGAALMAFLSPYPKFIASNQSTGARLASAALYSYVAGSATPLATYTDSTGSTANSNPVSTNAAGEADVWLDPANLYKLVLKDSVGNTQWTVDNVGGPSTYGQSSWGATLIAATSATAGRVVLGFPNIAAKGALIAGTAAGTLGALAVGSDGKALVAQSSQTTGLAWSTLASAPTNGPLNVTSYASAGTFTYNPATTTIGRVLVYAIGSGSGGNVGLAAGGGGGGNSGGLAIKMLSTSATGTSVTITVPAGGTSGAAGTSASFGTLCVATGGAVAPTYAGAGTAAGVGTVGDILVQGGSGSPGVGSGAGGAGGSGGAAPSGGGGGYPGTAAGVTGGTGGAPGGGGGGGYLTNNGGTGGAGAVVIYEYAL